MSRREYHAPRARRHWDDNTRASLNPGPEGLCLLIRLFSLCPFFPRVNRITQTVNKQLDRSRV